MTIEEYKKKFLELYEQLREEHGALKSVEISTDEICLLGGVSRTEDTIKILF